MERTLKVIGNANLSVKPDMTRIRIFVSNSFKTYSEASEYSALSDKKLLSIVYRCRLNESKLLTESFNISRDYENVDSFNNNTPKREIVYTCNHSYRIDFKNDNYLINKIIKELSDSELSLTLDISYFVSDEEKYKNEVLAKSVLDSKNKALTITNASETILGNIINIEYTSSDNTYLSGGNYRCMKIDRSSLDLNMHPDEIYFSDSVVVTWEIL